MSEQNLTFEEAMHRLEVVVGQLEQGNAPLAEALSLFEEGTALMKRCTSQLEQAEQAVALLTKGEDGRPVTQPLPEKESEA